MKKYYLNNNQQSNGDYEVHEETCNYLPLSNREDLGYQSSCQEAVREAKKRFPYRSKINGCYYCCRPCHTS